MESHMNKYRVTCKESADADQTFDFYADAQQCIDKYEREDKNNDTYQEGYWFIIEE